MEILLPWLCPLWCNIGYTLCDECHFGLTKQTEPEYQQQPLSSHCSRHHFSVYEIHSIRYSASITYLTLACINFSVTHCNIRWRSCRELCSLLHYVLPTFISDLSHVTLFLCGSLMSKATFLCLFIKRMSKDSGGWVVHVKSYTHCRCNPNVINTLRHSVCRVEALKGVEG